MTAEEILRMHAGELSDATDISVEVSSDGARLFVLLHDVPVPDGWTLRTSDVLFLTDSAYPLSALDMFWTDTGLTLNSGQPAPSSEVVEHYLGRAWRRFSWHSKTDGRPRPNPLLDHYALMEDRLAREVTV